MGLSLGLLAAIGIAIFNGVAAILEKIGADRQKIATSSHPVLLWNLRNNAPYLFGIVLDLLAWFFTLIAVHKLPLFLVQPIIACSIIVTVMVENYLFKRKPTSKFLLSIGIILAGLVMLALISTPEKSQAISTSLKWLISLSPLTLLVVGSIFSKNQKRYSTFILAAIGGLGFGGVSIAARAEVLSQPYYHLLYNPLSWSIIGYGLAGILFFTIALQRATASAVNAIMIVCETLFPIITGLTFLGDHPRNNLWLLMGLGVILTVWGTVLIAINYNKQLPQKE